MADLLQFPAKRLLVREPELTREEQLANILYGICLINPRIRSHDPEMAMEARMLLDVHCAMAKRLGVHRPFPPGGEAA